MSDDKRRAEFESWAESKCMSLTKINWKCGSVSEYAYTATFDAWQVWQAAYAAGQKSEREAIFIEWENAELLASEVEQLRAELAAAKADLAMVDATVAENELLRVTNERLAADLAAAKAASVVPVTAVPRLKRVAEFLEMQYDIGALYAAAWLRERMQDTTPPAT